MRRRRRRSSWPPVKHANLAGRGKGCQYFITALDRGEGSFLLRGPVVGPPVGGFLTTSVSCRNVGIV